MNITVEQAMSIYPLSEGRLIAGKDGSSRIVKSVNVMDAPDITEWIKEGEMLFTTAYLMKDHPEEAVGLLRKLDARGSAGLGVKLGRFWTHIPEPIVEEADRLQFPLIELPFQFTFSDQMSGLFYAEMERNTKSLHKLLEKQKKLMQFALKSGFETDFFSKVLAIIGYPFAVVSSRGQMVFNASSHPDGQLLKEWPWRQQDQWERMEYGGYYRIALEYKQECIGTVLFFPHGALHLKEEEGLFHQTAEMIAHHMSYIFRDALEQSLNKDLGELFARYLNQLAPIDMLVDYADHLGVRVLDRAYQCVLTKLSTSDREGRSKQFFQEVREEFAYNPVFRDLEVVHFVVEEGVFSIFRADAFDNAGKLAGLLSRCFEYIVNKGIISQIRLSVSSKKSKPELLRQAYTECSDALKLSERLGMSDRIVQFGSIELAYVFQHVTPEKMKAYSDEVLSELLAKDPDYSQEMLRTLELFLEHDGQVNEAAKHLFVHRNTAAYRLEKIGEMLSVDFKKIDDLLRLKLAFVFRRMVEEKRGTNP
ncbi:PucR family transcriptional regulator [Paenibacillus piri]|uniref:PucR family transcriptional regulator n=1 Tax=Paenibacillus piri TaxID=2547395 RepID=A0A4R5KY79_9BACL|nr:PucR family transcriptional regulator [Paenibacillus piri]TDG00543.1 PucR family transcriptional regulator [Paenibacillus piri]